MVGSVGAPFDDKEVLNEKKIIVHNPLTAFYTFPAVILRYSVFFISHLPTGSAGKREVHSVFVIKCQREGERKGRSRAGNDVKK